MSILTRHDIVAGLHDLAERLAGDELTVQIVVVGGAAMVLEHAPERGATRDVDCWVNSPPDVRESVSRHVATIGRERQWPHDWLNDAATRFFPENAGPSDWHTLLQLGSVTIDVADAKMLFVMKLRASRPTRDFTDLDVLADHLAVTSRDQVLELYDSRYPEDPLTARAAIWLHARFGA